MSLFKKKTEKENSQFNRGQKRKNQRTGAAATAVQPKTEKFILDFSGKVTFHHYTNTYFTCTYTYIRTGSVRK